MTPEQGALPSARCTPTVSRKFIADRALLDGPAIRCRHDASTASTRSVVRLLHLRHGLNRRPRPRAERFDSDLDSTAAGGLGPPRYPSPPLDLTAAVAVEVVFATSTVRYVPMRLSG